MPLTKNQFIEKVKNWKRIDFDELEQIPSNTKLYYIKYENVKNKKYKFSTGFFRYVSKKYVGFKNSFPYKLKKSQIRAIYTKLPNNYFKEKTITDINEYLLSIEAKINNIENKTLSNEGKIIKLNDNLHSVNRNIIKINNHTMQFYDDFQQFVNAQNEINKMLIQNNTNSNREIAKIQLLILKYNDKNNYQKQKDKFIKQGKILITGREEKNESIQYQPLFDNNILTKKMDDTLSRLSRSQSEKLHKY